MPRIVEDDTAMQAMIKMAEGNPGAISVIIGLMKKENGLISILQLDEMDIRGSKIWYGFKDYCKQDLDKFISCILTRDQDMQKFINDYYE